MPRYEYSCSFCEGEIVIRHLSDEIINVCPECLKEGGLQKKLSTFNTFHRSKKSKKRIGETTEEFIKTAREELQQQKSDLDEER